MEDKSWIRLNRLGYVFESCSKILWFSLCVYLLKWYLKQAMFDKKLDTQDKI